MMDINYKLLKNIKSFKKIKLISNKNRFLNFSIGQRPINKNL